MLRIIDNVIDIRGAASGINRRAWRARLQRKQRNSSRNSNNAHAQLATGAAARRLGARIVAKTRGTRQRRRRQEIRDGEKGNKVCDGD